MGAPELGLLVHSFVTAFISEGSRGGAWDARAPLIVFRPN